MTIIELCEKNNCYIDKGEGIINTRCPFCGDSQKSGHSSNYGQAYIFPDGFAKCFKCGKYTTTRQFVNQVFMQLNIAPDEELLGSLQSANVKYLYNHVHAGEYHDISEDEYNHFHWKVNYIDHRVYHNTTNSELCSYKMVLDLSKYDEYIQRQKRYICYDDYIGYVTYDNKKLILRAIVPGVIPHIKINLYEGEDLSFDFWANDTLVKDVISTRLVLMSEGIFNVINSNTNDFFNYDMAKVATLSKTNIINTISAIFAKTGIKYNLIFLKDKDVSNSYLSFVYKVSKPYLESFTVYSNINGTDCGEVNVTFRKEYIYMR